MKQEIIETYLGLKEQYGLNASKVFTSKKHSNKYKLMTENLFSSTDFLYDKEPLSKRVYCLIHNITEKPKCDCGSIIKSWSWNNGFPNECSKCALQNPERTKKTKNTCLEKYGVETNLQTPEIREQRLVTHKSTEFSEKMKKQWYEMSEEKLHSRNKKIKKTNMKKYGAENVFSKDSTIFKKVQANSKLAIKEKYGVDNIQMIPEIFEKGRQTRIELGYERHPDQKEDIEIYYSKVREITNKNFKENYYEITENETIKRNKENHLDHIYSIHYGFINNIPPYIIGHRNNLRLIPRSENSSKNKRCDITIDEILKGN